MKELIEALNIFLKYGDKPYPFHCEHDELTVDYDPSNFSEEDIEKLEKLGFSSDKEERRFYSFKYGSC